MGVSAAAGSSGCMRGNVSAVDDLAAPGPLREDGGGRTRVQDEAVH